MIKIYWIKLFITIFSIIFSFNSYAVKCNEESPNHKKEGDSYFDIKEVAPFTRNQKAKISKLFSHLIDHRLTGKGSVIECTGTERTAKKISKNEKLSAKITQQSDGKLVITLESFSKSKKSKHNETLRYFGYNNQHHINKISNDNLVISYKLRKPGKKGQIFVEEITDLSIKNSNLVIKVSRYIGGYFAVQHTRKLYLNM